MKISIDTEKLKQLIEDEVAAMLAIPFLLTGTTTIGTKDGMQIQLKVTRDTDEFSGELDIADPLDKDIVQWQE